MRLLLDTHALLWWAHDPAGLSAAALRVIGDGANDAMVSVVSAMEIATKSRKGRLEYQSALADRFAAEAESRGFGLVSINCAHAERAGRYASSNQDPWDRLLAAQAEIEGLTLVSCDAKMADFRVATFW